MGEKNKKMTTTPEAIVQAVDALAALLKSESESIRLEAAREILKYSNFEKAI